MKKFVLGFLFSSALLAHDVSVTWDKDDSVTNYVVSCGSFSTNTAGTNVVLGLAPGTNEVSVVAQRDGLDSVPAKTTFIVTPVALVENDAEGSVDSVSWSLVKTNAVVLTNSSPQYFIRLKMRLTPKTLGSDGVLK